MLFNGLCVDGFTSLTSLDNAGEYALLRFRQFADTQVLLHCKHQLFKLCKRIKLTHEIDPIHLEDITKALVRVSLK